MKILLTAFEAFGGDSINPTQEALKLTSDNICGAEIIKLCVPVVFKKSIATVYEAIKKFKPDAVLCLGQAAGRFAITPERVAINIDDARIADNEGNKPVDMPIFADGNAAYFSTLPIKAMCEEIKKGNLPANVSETAGTFVCNHLMYGVLYHADNEFPGMRAGFMHVPYATSQISDKTNMPSLALSDIVRGIEAALTAIINVSN